MAMKGPTFVPGPVDSIASFSRLQATTLSLLSGFVVLVLIAGAFHLEQQYREAVSAATRSARNIFRTVESHAERNFGETYRVLDGIADFYRVQLENKGFDEDKLHRLLATKLVQMPHVAFLSVLGVDRQIVADARYFPIAEQNEVPIGKDLKRPSEVAPGQFIGQIYKREPSPEGEIIDEWLLPIGVRIIGKEGDLLGYALALINPGEFSRFYDTLDLGSSGMVDLWSSDGMLVASSRNSTDKPGTIRPEIVNYLAAIDNTADGSSELAYSVSDGYSRRIQASGLVGNLHLSANVVLKAEDYLSAWRDNRNRIGLAMILVIASTIGGATFILRQLRRAQQNEQALRQAKVAAEEASDAKSKFLAHMSHEFRTPLNAIMGFSEIIKTKVLGEGVSPVYVSYAEHIHRSGEHLLKIVNDILDMAKIESGAQPMAREAFDVASAVAGAASFVEGLADQKRLHIRILMPAQLPRVNANERLTRQVFINLLSNAIKFSPSSSEIEVSARHVEAGPLEIMIGDRGPGIEPAILRRIGEPFLQGNPTVSRTGQGTGLGLSICKNYLNLMGGELSINSTVGRGTTAIVRFPPFLLIGRQVAAAE